MATAGGRDDGRLVLAGRQRQSRKRPPGGRRRVEGPGAALTHVANGRAALERQRTPFFSPTAWIGYDRQDTIRVQYHSQLATLASRANERLPEAFGAGRVWGSAMRFIWHSVMDTNEWRPSRGIAAATSVRCCSARLLAAIGVAIRIGIRSRCLHCARRSSASTQDGALIARLEAIPGVGATASSGACRPKSLKHNPETRPAPNAAVNVKIACRPCGRKGNKRCWQERIPDLEVLVRSASASFSPPPHAHRALHARPPPQ